MGCWVYVRAEAQCHLLYKREREKRVYREE
jgi:hypothetical protein